MELQSPMLSSSSVDVNNSPIIAASLRQSVTINDIKELYKSYMPYVKGGGLFLSFNDENVANTIFPNQKALIVLSILNKKFTVSGKVIWINKGKGYGVSFGDSPPMKALKEFIESTISVHTIKKEPTYTI